MASSKPTTLMVKDISKKLIDGIVLTNAGKHAAGLKMFNHTCELMSKLCEQIGIEQFAELNQSHRWTDKLFARLLWTVPNDMTSSGAYTEHAVAQHVAILEKLLVLLPTDQSCITSAHKALAYLRYNPDELDSFDYHYQMALQASPAWGYGYLSWAEGFESCGSSKKRAHAIEILEQGLGQPFFTEGEDIRIKLLERLIYRCTKERMAAEVERYTVYLRKLRPIVPVAPNLKIRRAGPCPCGSGKKYKDCCGLRSVQNETIGNFERGNPASM